MPELLDKPSEAETVSAPPEVNGPIYSTLLLLHVMLLCEVTHYTCQQLESSQQPWSTIAN